MIPKFDPIAEPATIGKRWTRWLNAYELFADGKGIILETVADDANAATILRARQTQQRRRALMLHLAGQEVQDIFTTLENTGERHEYEPAVDALNAYFVPQVNSAFARQIFSDMKQKAGETIQQFATRLRKAAADCSYGDDTDNHIRDMLLWKCPSQYVKRRLLEEGEGLTLARTLTIATQSEKIEAQMGNTAAEAVNRLSMKSENTRSHKGGLRKNTKTWQSQRQGETSGRTNKKNACYRCGGLGHYGRDPQCPAHGKECGKCHKKDHFAKVCKTNQANAVNDGGYDEEHSTSGEACEYAFHTTINSVSADDLYQIEVGGVRLNVLPDSGANSNIVDENTWETLKSKNVKCVSSASTCNKRIYSYANDKPLSVKGTFKCEVKAGKGRSQAEFIVVKGKGVPLIGKKTATNLGMLKVGIDIAMISEEAEHFRKEFPEVFTGLGQLKDTQVRLHIDPDVPPVAQPLRRTPFQLRDKVEAKLKQLVMMDIIEPVEGPTPWVNPTVIAPKRDGDIRLCIDMRRANEAIMRERHPIPTVDEVLQSLNGSKVFSELDLNLGYHQLELSPESREITTFVTHAGLYRYKRLLFGVNSASEVFQHKIGSALVGMEGVTNISDNIVVHAPDKATHDERMRQALSRIKAVNLTLNWHMCKIGMSELEFFGYLVSEKGIGPMDQWVQVVTDAREPENINELRSFLGLVNYSVRFIPRYATISEPLK